MTSKEKQVISAATAWAELEAEGASPEAISVALMCVTASARALVRVRRRQSACQAEMDRIVAKRSAT